MWRQRASSWLAIALVALFILQWFPYSGIFLMLFGAAVFTGLIFLALLLAIAVEALTGRLPRIAILIPFAVVAGYYAALLTQHGQVDALTAQIAARNAEPVDPAPLAGRTLLFELTGALLNDRYAVGALMSKYGIDTAYIRRFGGGMEDTMDELVVASQCTARATAWQVKDYGYPPVALCITEGVPLGYSGQVFVTRDSERQPFWTTGELVTITYSMAVDGVVLGTAGALQTQLWPYLPQPVIGCSLVSGGINAGWRCLASPDPLTDVHYPPEIRAIDGYFGDIDLSPIAQKLGLPLR